LNLAAIESSCCGGLKGLYRFRLDPDLVGWKVEAPGAEIDVEVPTPRSKLAPFVRLGERDRFG
jgi:hypothetical protein